LQVGVVSDYDLLALDSMSGIYFLLELASLAYKELILQLVQNCSNELQVINFIASFLVSYASHLYNVASVISLALLIVFYIMLQVDWLILVQTCFLMLIARGRYLFSFCKS
jgi:hypothetical protein